MLSLPSLHRGYHGNLPGPYKPHFLVEEHLFGANVCAGGRHAIYGVTEAQPVPYIIIPKSVKHALSVNISCMIRLHTSDLYLFSSHKVFSTGQFFQSLFTSCFLLSTSIRLDTSSSPLSAIHQLSVAITCLFPEDLLAALHHIIPLPGVRCWSIKTGQDSPIIPTSLRVAGSSGSQTPLILHGF